jgi:hypothetical protein
MMKMFCELCHRDVSGDDGYFSIRLNANFRRAKFMGGEIDLCMKCAEREFQPLLRLLPGTGTGGEA